MANDSDTAGKITAAIERRFGERIEVDADTPGLEEIARMLDHCSMRQK